MGDDEERQQPVSVYRGQTLDKREGKACMRWLKGGRTKKQPA